MNYIIYLAVSPSNKFYVGYTGRSLEARILEHVSQSNTNPKKIFHKALNKYNKNFKWIVLKDNMTLEQAKSTEIQFIKFFKSNNRDYGYNGTSGGEGFHGVHTEESKKKNSIKQKTRMQNKELKQKTIDGLNFYYKNHPNARKEMALAQFAKPENKQRLLNQLESYRKTMPEKLGKPRVKISLYDTIIKQELHFNSLADAARYIGYSNSSVANLKKQKIKKLDKYILLEVQ